MVLEEGWARGKLRNSGSGFEQRYIEQRARVSESLVSGDQAKVC